MSDQLRVTVHNARMVDGKEYTAEGDVSLSDLAHAIGPATLAQLLAKAVNCGSVHPRSNTARLLNEALYDEHRTLQAMVIQLLVEVLLQYKPGQFVDLRNQAAAECCAQFRNVVEKGEVNAYIPLV